jgi:hypothetical protein
LITRSAIAPVITTQIPISIHGSGECTASLISFFHFALQTINTIAVDTDPTNAPTKKQQPRALPIIRCRPDRVSGIPMRREILCLNVEMPNARFQEKDKPYFLMAYFCLRLAAGGQAECNQRRRYETDCFSLSAATGIRRDTPVSARARGRGDWCFQSLRAGRGSAEDNLRHRLWYRCRSF